MLPSRLFLDDMFDREDAQDLMKCDIYEHDGKVILEVDVPGFNKKDITIEFNKGYLNITAVKNKEENNHKKYYRRERKMYGKYERRFYLGDIDEEKIEANFNDGILTIVAPKRDNEASKKLITIK